ncbi:MAG: hypothetical protein ABH845_05385 [Candidatus Omnitrophota bacterium]
MIDRDVEEKIKKTKEFMELWMKFHTLYKEALKKESITPQDEEIFLETKSLIARKYQALTDLLKEFSSMEEKPFDVISQVLSLQGVSAFSDIQLGEIEDDWHKSYLTLNKLLGLLESRKETLAKVNPLALVLPKIFAFIRKTSVWKYVKLIVIILIAYVVFVRVFHLDEKLRVLVSDSQPLQSLLNSLSGGGQK